MTERRRDLADERLIVDRAVRGMVDTHRLLAHCRSRAKSLSGEYVQDPMQVRVGMDRVAEVTEEVADAVNHLVWGLQENPDLVGGNKALELLAMAYDALGSPA